LTSGWVNERKKDYYYRKAKREKFRSRASYKLFQAVKKYAFIKPANVVVDLGAAPGGWIQAARKIVDDSGFILAVDLKPIEPFNTPNIRTIVSDITEDKSIKDILEFLPSSADVVISDVSPNVSGIWELDHARQIDLAKESLRIATSILKPGGNFFVKVFQGSMTHAFVKDAKKHFSFVKLIKPKASRSKSAELYLLGMNFKPKK
jgi:23S rRNA (uridine2552-2'-O)-methyltransferase